MFNLFKRFLAKRRYNDVETELQEFTNDLNNIILSETTIDVLINLTNRLQEFAKSLDSEKDYRIQDLYKLHLMIFLDVLKYRKFERFILIHSGKEIRFNSLSSLNIYIAEHNIMYINKITDRFIEVNLSVNSRQKILQCFAR